MFLWLLSACVFGAASSQLLQLWEGEDCRALGGGQGVCRALSQCRTAGDFKTNHPPICSFKGKEPIICCPSMVATKSKAGHKAEQFCAELDTKCRRNLNLSKNVIGGFESAPRTNTFMALIGYGNQEDIFWACGGTLITARYILSAAHCVNHPTSGSAEWARLGELDKSSDAEDAKPVDKRIVERIPYPDYVVTLVYHDVAIFRLDSDVAFNQWVMPICLQTKREIDEDWATVIGWGRIGFVDATSEKLLEADVNVYNDTECRRVMFSSTNPKTPQGYRPDLMFCAGVPDGSKGACSGDSGGPLVIRKVGECVKTQIGITSYGNQCGLPDAPGVLTRVYSYVGWIEDIVFGEDISQETDINNEC